ncbi:MAG: right-handed parallel beta-helix repeat-containing protein [archaeon]
MKLGDYAILVCFVLLCCVLSLPTIGALEQSRSDVSTDRITSPLDDITITSCNTHVYENGTRILLEQDIYCQENEDGIVLHVASFQIDCQNHRIVGRSLTGGRTNAGIRLPIDGSFIDESRIDNCVIEGFVGGIWKSPGLDESPMNVILHNNTLFNNSVGIYVDRYRGGITLSNNTVVNNIYGINCANSILRGNRIQGNTAIGVLNRDGDSTFQDNRIHGNGIGIESWPDVALQNNSVQGNGIGLFVHGEPSTKTPLSISNNLFCHNSDVDVYYAHPLSFSGFFEDNYCDILRLSLDPRENVIRKFSCIPCEQRQNTESKGHELT